MQKNRIPYLDIARGLGILLVVIGHVEVIDASLRGYVTSFHMPLFFAISGVLMQERDEEREELRAIARKKLHRLMLPYLIFSLLSFVIEGARMLLKHLDGWEILFRQLCQSLCLQGVSTLWFLPAMFFATLLFLWLRRHTGHRGTILLVSVLTAAAWLCSLWEKSLLLPLADVLPYGLLHDILSMMFRSVFCVCFVCVGYYFAYMCGRFRLKKRWELLCAILLLLLTALLNRRSGPVDIRFMTLGNPVLCLGETIGGSVGVLMLCRAAEGLAALPVGRIFSYYGRNSLIVMVTHMDFRVLNYSIRLAAFINVLLQNQFLYCVLILVFVFVMEIAVIECVRRFFPFVIGR